MKMRALIGHSGFVGGNLRRLMPFDALFNSKNIEDISGRSFAEIVCAGVRAEKWRANADPEEDRAAIAHLTNALETVRADRFVLISTVDVYPVPRGVDERTDIAPDDAQPYGRNRFLLEQFVSRRFAALVIRLPALFGPGLKKNAIYDLLHDHDVHRIDGRGVFQFYDVERLANDIATATANSVELLNVATPPIAIAEIAETYFGRRLTAGDSTTPPCYDVRSVHAAVWGGADGYLYSRGQVMQEFGQYIDQYRSGAQSTHDDQSR